ncbi:hypothetical protein [Flagellimonas sp.]|uniref:hypothetical protein n=1 Tax=Flagellimonas sp. TaxID=2058762 RepID=UPI003BAFCB73
MPKKLQANFLDAFVRICCSLICLCYLLGALQIPVLRLMHGISHWMSAHSTHYHQNAKEHHHVFLDYGMPQTSHDHEDPHSHRLISWFKQFLDHSDTNEGTQERPFKKRIDKHLISQDCTSPHFFCNRLFRQTIYIIPIVPDRKEKIPTPPPQHC